MDDVLPGANPRLERLAKAVKEGDIDVVRAELDSGGDPNEPWRDLPGLVSGRSLLLRTVWYMQGWSWNEVAMSAGFRVNRCRLPFGRDASRWCEHCSRSD